MEALAYAMEYESIVNASKPEAAEDKGTRRKWGRQVKLGDEDEALAMQLQLDELKEEIAKLKPQQQKTQEKRPRRSKAEIICYGCQQRGHVARECPKKKRATSDSTSVKQPKSN